MNTHLVKQLRTQMAELLPTYYPMLNGGGLQESVLEEFKLETMQRTLNSTESFGYGFFHYLSILFDKDIYIIDGRVGDLYMTTDYVFTVLDTRKTVILNFYDRNHYELVGRVRSDGLVTTYFDPEDALVVALRERLKEIRRKCEL